jgi:hypothetical protein
MNDPFVHQQAGIWADRVRAKPAPAAARVREMYLRAFGRPPTNEEQAACLEFLAEQGARHGETADSSKAWADLAHTLFNAKEFIYLN